MCPIQVPAVPYLMSLFRWLWMFRAWLKSVVWKLSLLIPFLKNTAPCIPCMLSPPVCDLFFLMFANQRSDSY